MNELAARLTEVGESRASPPSKSTALRASLVRERERVQCAQFSSDILARFFQSNRSIFYINGEVHLVRQSVVGCRHGDLVEATGPLAALAQAVLQRYVREALHIRLKEDILDGVVVCRRRGE